MSDTLTETMNALGINARRAARALGVASTALKNQALQAAANELRKDSAAILQANQEDLKLAEAEGVNKARLDRIMLDEARLEGIAQALEAIIALPDPVGRAWRAGKCQAGWILTACVCLWGDWRDL